MRRRDFLRGAGGGTAAVAAAAGTAGTAAAQPSFGGWMANVGNYSGVTDKTGQKEVTVDVGVEANGGAFGFGPAAVQVDPGTTVVWTWTGEGGQHNVVANSGASFESALAADAGFTFEHTFESEGVTTYYCQPHQSLGMKGVVVVGAVPESGGSGGGGEKELHELGVAIQAHWVGSVTILGIIVSIVFTFYILKYGETPHSGHGGSE
ncbi:MAG: halocyanin domain-containing protein [Haloferacaceae archaeon]